MVPATLHHDFEAESPPREIETRWPPLWKRAFDIVVSLGLLLVTAPLLLAISVWIKLGSKGPVIFRQDRLGIGGRYFQILKFRTLRVNDDSLQSHRAYVKSIDPSAPAIKPNLDDRLIPGGRKLRGWSLDELPQLVNVLRGDMSLIGPRPDVLHLEDYSCDRDLRRFEVLPGITGLWQVSGKNRLTQQEMIDLDIRYVDGHSFRFDIWIFAKTFWILLRQDND